MLESYEAKYCVITDIYLHGCPELCNLLLLGCEKVIDFFQVALSVDPAQLENEYVMKGNCCGHHSQTWLKVHDLITRNSLIKKCEGYQSQTWTAI